MQWRDPRCYGKEESTAIRRGISILVSAVGEGQ